MGFESMSSTGSSKQKSSSKNCVKYQPHDYQKRAIKLLVSQVVAGLLMDPGMGKTSCVLAAIKMLKQRGYIERVLIVAPLRVIYNVWPAEIEKWKDFNGLSVTVLHGNKKHDLVMNDDAVIHLVNPEGLFLFVDKLNIVYTKKNGTEAERTEYRLKKEFKKHFPYDMLVIDESTKFKRASTDRFKRLKQMLKKFTRRVILTGTPAPNGLLDLFGQVYILDLGLALGEYITRYRERWFSPSGYGGFTWLPKVGAEEEIYDAIRPYMLRLEDKDYLKLPKLIKTNIEVTLPLKVRAMYRDMEEELIAQLDKNLVVAKNSAVATGKCRQIAGGGVYVSDKHGNSTKNVEHLHYEKAEAVADIIEELQGKPALVLYEYEHDLTRLLKVLGKDTAYIKGGMTITKTNRILESWNAGELTVLLAQVDTVAHGLNLQATGRAIIFHSMTWNLETYIQALKRIWRQGQRFRTFLYHVIAKGTIDEVILEAVLGGKMKTQNDLLNALKSKLLKPKRRKVSKK